MAKIVIEIDDARDFTCVITSDCEMPSECERMTNAQRLATYILFYIERFGNDIEAIESSVWKTSAVH